jgi:FixJ family two-component response regulator
MQPVVVIETDEAMRKTLVALLAESGFGVIAFDQAWGIFLLSEPCDPPLLLVTGINLGPGFDGFKLAAAARCRWPALPVMGITGRPARYVPLDDQLYDWFRTRLLRPERFIADVRSLIRSSGPGR